MKTSLSVIVLLSLALVLLAGARASHTAEDREYFLAAEEALERGDLGEFERLATGLEDYPLRPYLGYARLTQDLGGADPQAIDQFLAAHADTPLAGRLRRSWLDRLAKEGRWRTYLRFYVPDESIARRCQYLWARLRSGQGDEVLDQVVPLWLRGKSLPGACDPVLDAWRQAGGMTVELVWQRFALAMDAGELKLANYLAGLLPSREGAWAERWRAVHRDPDKVLNADNFAEAHPYRPQVLAYGIARLAHRAPAKAADAWDRLAGLFAFPADQAQRANAAVGLALAAQGDQRGFGYLDRIPAGAENLDLQEQRLRAALKLEHWDGVADWVAAMPGGQRKSEHWLYWQARAAEAGGNSGLAQALFGAAASERSLWGFLAAERVDRPYALGDIPTPADPQLVERIEQSAAAARIGELEALGRGLGLGREWRKLTSDMGEEELMAAAVIAQRRGWPDQAIFTLAKSGYWDDLGLRFPLLHRDKVRQQAIATGLNESWIYAVLRQESAFNPKALSGAGAVGLMQLMPATAHEVASSLDLPRPSRARLQDPGFNLILGSVYLARMQRRFGGNPVVATAAYNAGPARVERWLPDREVDADVWIATIPWRETRAYVRRVLAYRLIYDYRLGKPIEPLHRIMRPVQKRPPAGDVPAACSGDTGDPECKAP